MDLNGGRQCGMSLNPIAWGDMRAFFDLYGHQPLPFEIRLIRAFDRAFLTVYAPQPKEQTHEQ